MTWAETDLDFDVATGVSSSGAIICGYTGTPPEALYWEAEAITLLGLLSGGTYSQAFGISADGTQIVGQADSPGATNAFSWTSGGGIVALPGFDGSNNSSAFGVNGGVAVGLSNNLPCYWQSGDVFLLSVPGDATGYAEAISEDASTIVGAYTDDSSITHAVSWTGPGYSTLTDLGNLGGTLAEAYAVSADGSVIVGEANDGSDNQYAFMWTLAGGMTSFASGAGYAVSGDGLTLGGQETPSIGAFVWTLSEGIVNLGGSTFSTVSGLDDNGLIAVGTTGGHAVYWTTSPPPTQSLTVAELFFGATMNFVDFTQVGNRRRFIAVNGGAQNLQTDGSGPFAVAPPVFLSREGSNPPDSFAQNFGRGGSFIVDGPDLTDGSSNPPPVTVTILSAATNKPFSAVLGSYLDGSIFAFDPDTLTDNGAQRKWVRRWRALPGETTSSISFSYLAIDMETGIEVPPGTNPQLVLRWSDDGGHTWSAERFVPVGASGQTSFTVKFNRLGSTSRFSGSTRIFELSSTDPFKVSIISAEVMTK